MGPLRAATASDRGAAHRRCGGGSTVYEHTVSQRFWHSSSPIGMLHGLEYLAHSFGNCSLETREAWLRNGHQSRWYIVAHAADDFGSCHYTELKVVGKQL